MSKKPTPPMATTAPSGCHSFVDCPHTVVNFLRAAMIAPRSRVFFGTHPAAGISPDQVGTGVEQDEVDVAVAPRLNCVICAVTRRARQLGRRRQNHGFAGETEFWDPYGSGLLLIDDRTEPGVQILAKRTGTSVTLQRGDQRRVLTP
jgi:hypothetical protein